MTRKRITYEHLLGRIGVLITVYPFIVIFIGSSTYRGGAAELRSPYRNHDLPPRHLFPNNLPDFRPGMLFYYEPYSINFGSLRRKPPQSHIQFDRRADTFDYIHEDIDTFPGDAKFIVNPSRVPPPTAPLGHINLYHDRTERKPTIRPNHISPHVTRKTEPKVVKEVVDENDIEATNDTKLCQGVNCKPAQADGVMNITDVNNQTNKTEKVSEKHDTKTVLSTPESAVPSVIEKSVVAKHSLPVKNKEEIGRVVIKDERLEERKELGKRNFKSLKSVSAPLGNDGVHPIHRRPFEGMPELLEKAEHKLEQMEDLIDNTQLRQISKVMLAWEAHRKKVEEELGIIDGDSERKTNIGSTTISPAQVLLQNSGQQNTFQLFGSSRRAVGRSWSRLVRRMFPESLKKMLLIFPGTIWCGAGNKADNDTQKLGHHNETDFCCREHDLSEEYITAGQRAPEYGNIHNKYSFTMSTCENDRKFRECLQRNAENGSDSSEAVGYLYFTIIKPKCFMKIAKNCTSSKERCSRSSEDHKWEILENEDFPEPSPQNRLLEAVVIALRAIRTLFPRGVAESWSSVFG